VYFANLLVMIGLVVQAVFIAVLVWRRTYRSFPVFFSYIVWGVIGDGAVLIMRTWIAPSAVYPFEVEAYVDSLFQYLVLIELAWSILRPIQRLLPKGFLLGISLVIAAAAFVVWPLSGIEHTVGYPGHLLIVLHAERTFAILRILFFIALACCSHFLAIGLRDRELQVATGLGFYSLVSVAGTMMHSSQSYGLNYLYVDIAIACSYLMSLLYWCYSFAQQEAARREMTPEMQGFLLGVAKVMRKQREQLSKPTFTNPV